MTQVADFNFVIDNRLTTIHINAIGASIASGSLAPNISLVQFDAASGVGRITYNDRPPLPELFSDPSPYQPQINSWMSVLSGATVPLTLAQAQAVKGALVDAIWSGKRQAAVSVSTSLGSFSFDANDILSGALNIGTWMTAAASLITDVNSTNTAIGTAVAAIITSVNSALSTVTTTTVSDVNGLAGAINTVIASFNSQAVTQGVAITLSNVSGASPFSASASASYSGPSALPALTAPVKMLPVGATSYPAFTLADLFAVITAVQTQRNNEAAARNTNQAAIAALTTVAQCIAFDATTGW